MSNRRDDDTLPAAVPVSAIFVGGVAARNLAAGGEPRPAKALARAAAMRSAGASADAIHAETSRMLAGTPYAGVHYGVDGKPRFEISDEGARVRPAALDKSGRGFVGDFLAHGDLYKALPEAQLLGLEKAKFSGGGYDGQTVHVGRNHFADKMLAGRHMERQSARGVVLHELQHYAQDVEGFAPGASPDDFRRQFPNNEAMRVKLYETTAGEVEAENTRARRNYTAAQRRETAPSKTTTVPVSEQHLGHHEGGMARQFGGDLPKGYSVKRHTNSIGQTNYDIYVRGRFFGKQKVGNAYVRDLGDRVQVGRISIDEPHQRKGIATALYAQIERDLGKKVVPDDTLSAKAAAFWRKHRPEALASHRELGDGSLMIDPYGMFKTEYADPATGGARTGEVRRIQRMVDKPSAGSKPRKGDIIEDFGEKIGGARKDTAKAPRRTTAGKPSGPAYERQFVAMESRHRPGEWYLFKAPSGRGRYGGIVSKRVGGPFPSEAVANAAKPLAAVSTTHAVMGVSGGGYGIKRHTTKGYIPAAGGQTFPTRDEALAYMAQHVEDLLQAKTPKGFGEALLREVKVTHTERIGPKVASGDVSPDQFMKTFAPRGVEFGNWEDGARRGKLLTASYEALHDLSRVLEVDPSGLTMGGKLGLSFGARGTGGVNAGSATYHPDYGTMNFTKPHGSGALAHEYMHALDHLLGRLDDPALDQKVTNSRGDQVWKTAQEASFATNRVAWYARQQTLNAEVRTALADLMKTMTAKTVSEVEPVEPLQRSADRAMTEARNILEQTRRGLTETVSYRSRHNKPATAEQLAAFDKHAAALLAGEGGAVPYKSVSLGRRSPNDVPFEHPHLRGISEVMRQVRGKSGFGDYYGSLDSVAQNMRAAQDIQKRLAAAAASVGRERTAPTDFLRNARKLDQTRTSPYWTERHEMFARAGEAWIHDKLTARGEASPYLVAGSKNTFEAAKAAILGGMDDTPKPFPEGAERVAINAKFENLFSAMKRAGILPGMAVTAEPSGTGAPRAAAPAPETSGLRGTQNPANLAAIVENRQANAQGEQPAPAKPKASADGAVKPGSVTPSVTSVTKATGKTVADQGTVAPSVTRAAPSRDVTIGDNGGPSEQALKTAARLEDVAKRTIEKAEAEANRPRLMNTARRARMGGGVVERAQQDIADAKTALKIAEALRNGEAGALSTVKSLADIRELRRLAREAEYATDRKENRGYKPGGYGLAPDDVKNVGGAKGYVRLEPSTVAELKTALAGKKGLAADFNVLARYADMAKARGSFATADPAVFKAVANVSNAIKKADKLNVERPHQAKMLKYSANKYLDEVRDFNRKVKLAGVDAGARQEALKAFLDVRAGKTSVAPAVALERELIGQKIPGFFPTPERLAKRMAELADIQAGQTVLEPSAGTGRLAAAAKAMGANVDAVEVVPRLQEILKAKGLNVVDSDFTSMDVAPKYDRILMNPPFEKGQDMAHVKRAYEMLKPGGKMVAIMGEGGFFRSDSQASGFRSWLNDVGGVSEKLPEGTFKESNTGVNTRLVTISKPAGSNLGWSDAARVRAAEARGVALPGEAKPQAANPAVSAAVERAMQASEAARAKPQASTLTSGQTTGQGVAQVTPDAAQLPDNKPAGGTAGGVKMAQSDKLPRGFGVYSRARTAGLSHDAAIQQTSKALAVTTDRVHPAAADVDGLKAAWERAQAKPGSQEAVRAGVSKINSSGKVTASVKFEYDPERVQRFKAAFPTAKFNPTTKEWTVAGVTAQKRIDKWQAIDADATAKAALAEAKARDALAFDKPKVQHPWVTQGKSGYAIKTPYDPDLVKAIKSLPGARWDATAKTWNVPLRSVDALAAKLPEIDRIASASKTIAADAARRQTLEAERKASEAKWEKLNADRQAQWAKETAARQAQKSAQVHKPRSIVLAERAPEVGTAVRLGNKVLTVEGLGKIYRADENTSSVGGPIGAEGERVRNVYYRDPTAAEVAALETREAAAKAAAQAQKVKADALHAMREAFREKGQMPAKMDQIPKGATVLQSGSQNSRLYGGGEDYVLRGKTLYQVIGNSADGDDWSVSNAPGSIVKQVPVTPDLLARMRAAADRPAKGVGPQALSGKIGFQNEANLNAALEAQGKAAAGKANPAARADARTEFMAAAKTVKLPGGGFEVTAPDGTKIAMPNAGTEAAAKITAFAKIGAAVNKLGAISMIAAPTAAAYVAYHATKDQANAAGRDGTAEAVGQAAVAGGTVAGIGYAAMKTLGGAMKLAAKVAPKIAPALGPAGVALGVGMTGYAAYQGYKRHGAKGALAATVGVDVLLDAKPPAAAAQQPVQGRLSDAQQQQFATANAAYAAMKTRTEQAADGMTKSYTRHVNGQPVKVRAYKTPQR